jgi:hypothetical protein
MLPGGWLLPRLRGGLSLHTQQVLRRRAFRELVPKVGLITECGARHAARTIPPGEIVNAGAMHRCSLDAARDGRNVGYRILSVGGAPFPPFSRFPLLYRTRTRIRLRQRLLRDTRGRGRGNGA